MPRAPDVYDRLKTTQVNELTVNNLDSSTKESFIEASNVKLWGQSITLNRTLEASRCYPNGLIIPETGSIDSEGVAATEFQDFQPSGTEIWQVIGLSVTSDSGTPTVQVFLTDGSSFCLMHSSAVATTGTSMFPFEAPFTISKTLYLRVVNMDGSIDVTANLAYSKVGL